MSPETSRGSAPHVAAGVTREQAARSFAPAHDDVLVTSFDDFDAEVDLAAVDNIDLVAGEGMEAVLRSVVAARPADRAVALRTTVPTQDDEAFVALLRRLDLQIVRVEVLAGRPVLALGPRGSDRAEADALVVQAVRVASDHNSRQPEPDHVRPSAAATPVRGPDATPAPRPVPHLVEVLGSLHRLRESRRRRLVALVAGAVALVVLVGLGVWADSAGTLLAVALPVLVVLVVLAAGTALYTTLLLARQVNVQTGRLERAVLRNRAVVQKRTTALEKRTAALERQVAAVERGQARFPFALEYLEALGDLEAETAGRLRDLNDSLNDS